MKNQRKSLQGRNESPSTKESSSALTAEQIEFAAVVGRLLAENWLETMPRDDAETPIHGDVDAAACGDRLGRDDPRPI